jgi:hypothetical protein
MSCYSYENYQFETPLLNVDATYVIHLIGNGRYNTIRKNLHEFPISKQVHILLNPGYKKCPKQSVDNPPLDLVDAFLTIFKHAQEHEYENILVLEDDFMFDEKLKDSYHSKNINTFLKHHQDEKIIYYLGTLPYLSIPYDYTTYTAVKTIGSHSVIYNAAFINYTLSFSNKMHDWDDYINFRTNNVKRYMYYTPLCYQLFTETENSQYWAYHWPVFIQIIWKYVVRGFIKVCLLDKQIHPGYDIYYLLSKLLLPLLLVYLVYFIVKNKTIKKIFR